MPVPDRALAVGSVSPGSDCVSRPPDRTPSAQSCLPHDPAVCHICFRVRAPVFESALSPSAVSSPVFPVGPAGARIVSCLSEASVLSSFRSGLRTSFPLFSLGLSPLLLELLEPDAAPVSVL